VFKVQDTDPDITSTPHSFSVVANSRCLVLAAGSADEKEKWMADIGMVGAAAVESGTVDVGSKITYPSLKSNSM